MAFIELKGREIEIDADGFLVKAEAWDEDVAVLLAGREGIKDLPPDMLDILKFLRSHYFKYNFFPILRHVCKNVGQPAGCVVEKFPEPVTAWKIAGLPNPGQEVNMFGSWEPLGF